VKAYIEVECRRCHRVFNVDVDYGLGYSYASVKCPYCSALHHVRIDVSVKHLDVTDRDLDEFEEWLIKEKKLVSARQYRRQVENYLETGRMPKTPTAVIHFQEFMRSKGREFTVY